MPDTSLEQLRESYTDLLKSLSCPHRAGVVLPLLARVGRLIEAYGERADQVRRSRRV